MGITSGQVQLLHALEGHPTCAVHADTSTISGAVSRFAYRTEKKPIKVDQVPTPWSNVCVMASLSESGSISP